MYPTIQSEIKSIPKGSKNIQTIGMITFKDFNFIIYLALLKSLTIHTVSPIHYEYVNIMHKKQG